MSLTIPFYNKRQAYSASYFENHKLQKLMALFISKPELYSGIYTQPLSSKQAYFFEKFRRFIDSYETFGEKDFDANFYFNDLSIDKLGSANICGGGGSRSNSGRKDLIQKYKIIQENNRKLIEYYKEKYNIQITQLVDERVFVGKKEIWKNPKPEMVEHMKSVIESAYDDETLTKPFPEYLDKDLIPLKIRNKVYQKWASQFKIQCGFERPKIDQSEIDREEEEKFLKAKNAKQEPVPQVVFVAPEIDEDEW